MQGADEVFGSSAAAMAVLALSTQINGIVLLLCLEMGCELPSEHSSVKFGHGDRRVQPLQAGPAGSLSSHCCGFF